jgi:hypothetical protein
VLNRARNSRVLPGDALPSQFTGSPPGDLSLTRG